MLFGSLTKGLEGEGYMTQKSVMERKTALWRSTVRSQAQTDFQGLYKAMSDEASEKQTKAFRGLQKRF